MNNYYSATVRGRMLHVYTLLFIHSNLLLYSGPCEWKMVLTAVCFVQILGAH